MNITSIYSLFQGPASPPQNLIVTSINSRTVYLSWSPPPSEHHNGIIRQFELKINEVDTGRRIQRTSVGTSFTISSLHPFYTYWFSVAAYTVDLGPFTEPSVLQMPQDGKNIVVLLNRYINVLSLLVYAQPPALLQATTLQYPSPLVQSF